MRRGGREGIKSIPVPADSFAMERSQSNSWVPLRGIVPLPKCTHVGWSQSSYSPTEGAKQAENHLRTKVMSTVLGSTPGPALHGQHHARGQGRTTQLG